MGDALLEGAGGDAAAAVGVAADAGGVAVEEGRVLGVGGVAVPVPVLLDVSC